MAVVMILVLSLSLSYGEAGILRNHRYRADRVGNDLRHYQPSAGDPGPYCGPCDTRNCPLVSAETCQGQVVKDRCGCCPFCDTHKPATSLVSTESNNTAKTGCEEIQCPRSKVCLLNIQNIPMCRCPSAYFCRRQHMKVYRKEGDSHLCGRDGKTYRNRCLLQVAECASNKKIRVAHRGKCLTDTPNRKQRGQRKHNSKSVGVAGANANGRTDSSDTMTQVVSQYPNNQQQQYPNNRDKYHPSIRDREGVEKGKQKGRRQKHHKIKENRRQRRKERINRRTKRRYRIYWL